MSDIATARTFLFVPGDRPDRFDKAVASGADQVIVDLEDAVPPARKDVARANVAGWLAAGGQAIVRINALDSPWFDDDVRAVTAAGSRSVMVPKAESGPSLNGLVERLAPGSCIVAILESARGILGAPSICAVPGVVRVAFGNADLAVDLGVDHSDWEALSFARSAVVVASAGAGLAPPIDGVTMAIRDSAALRSDTLLARRFGFSGKLCIHPAQIPTVRAAFDPTAEEVEWAEKVLAVAADGGAVAINGAMVDKPMVDKARRIVGLARSEVSDGGAVDADRRAGDERGAG